MDSIFMAVKKVYFKRTNNGVKEFVAPTVVELVKAPRKLEAELCKRKLCADVGKEMAKTAISQSVSVKIADQVFLLANESAKNQLSDWPFQISNTKNC